MTIKMVKAEYLITDSTYQMAIGSRADNSQDAFILYSLCKPAKQNSDYTTRVGSCSENVAEGMFDPQHAYISKVDIYPDRPKDREPVRKEIDKLLNQFIYRKDSHDSI